MEKIRIDNLEVDDARSWEAFAIILNHTKNRPFTSTEFDLGDPAFEYDLQGASAVTDVALLKHTLLEELVVKYERCELDGFVGPDDSLENPFPDSLAKLQNLHAVRFQIDSKFCLHNFPAPSGSLRERHFQDIILDGHLKNSLAQVVAQNPHLSSIVSEHCETLGENAHLI